MSEKRAASIFKRKSRAWKRVVRIKVCGREGHQAVLGGLRESMTLSNHNYTVTAGGVRSGKTYEGGNAVGKSELTTKLLFYPEY